MLRFSSVLKRAVHDSGLTQKMEEVERWAVGKNPTDPCVAVFHMALAMCQSAAEGCRPDDQLIRAIERSPWLSDLRATAGWQEGIQLAWQLLEQLRQVLGTTNASHTARVV
jgi:hypothetical protein